MWRAQASSRLAASESRTAVSASTRRIAAIASRAASGVPSRTTGSVTTDSGSESFERRETHIQGIVRSPVDLSWLGELGSRAIARSHGSRHRLSLTSLATSAPAMPLTIAFAADAP